MALVFLHGDDRRPRGHALVVFRRAPGSDDAVATYAVVLPLVVDPMKYVPPALAAQFQGVAGAMGSLDAVPMPPIPEPMAVSEAMRLAARRDDDLLDGGVADDGPIAMMHRAQEVVREYAEAYRASDAHPGSGVATIRNEPGDDVAEWLWLDDRGRIDEMTRLVGRLRDEITQGNRADAASLRARMGRLGSTMAAKYRAAELVAGAARPGHTGSRLAELYLDRCYRLCGEHYEGLAELDREIERLEQADDPRAV